MIPDKLIRLKDKLEKFRLNAPIFLEEILKDLAPVIEDLLAAQLQKGEKGDGTKLPDYSPRSVKIYGKPAGPIRLKDTGDFYRGMTLKVTAKDFEITDTDKKTGKLTEEYGDSILQLNEESLNILLNDYVIIEFQKKVDNYFNESK